MCEWGFVGHVEGGTWGEGVRGKNAPEGILGYEGRSKGDWRRLYKEVLHDMNFSSDILLIFSRRITWAGHVALMGDRRVACRVWVERPEKRRPLPRQKLRLEDNTKMDL